MHGAETKNVFNGSSLLGLEMIQDHGPTDKEDLKFRAVQHLWMVMTGQLEFNENQTDVALQVLQLPKD